MDLSMNKNTIISITIFLLIVLNIQFNFEFLDFTSADLNLIFMGATIMHLVYSAISIIGSFKRIKIRNPKTNDLEEKKREKYMKKIRYEQEQSKR